MPIGNDRISSIKVESGYFGYFYRDTGFRGPRLVLFPGNYSYVADWNDKISSMEIFEHDAKIFPLISFYEHADFGGLKQNLAGLGEVVSYNFPYYEK
ncbi:beta/gamma crystallin-related protein [Algoriphagus sp. Y33]|uniref:beta/gamma crystallin-related protein n=1 Tax=Algoriphagus sp. Y33 TaxID=2772483 RepID=UPI00351BF1F0